MLRSWKYTYEMLMEQPLYPDQMVFLTDTFFIMEHIVNSGYHLSTMGGSRKKIYCQLGE